MLCAVFFSPSLFFVLCVCCFCFVLPLFCSVSLFYLSVVFLGISCVCFLFYVCLFVSDEDV